MAIMYDVISSVFTHILRCCCLPFVDVVVLCVLIQAGPFFFHGFLRQISRAREIENDEFHGHFTG